MKISALTLAFALAFSGAAFAESPFVGSWKMDAAKSNFTGETLIITKTATGYHYSNGSAMNYDFADDGKPYPMVFPGHTTTWTKSGDGGWDVAFTANGKVLTKVHRTLSADGSTITSTYEEYRPDGTTAHESDVYTRVSGGTGLDGTWKSVKVDAADDAVMISPVTSMSYKLDYPTSKMVVTAKLDGSPASIVGPTVPAGVTSSFKKADPSKWTYSNMLAGKVMGEGIMTVSTDGSTLTDTSWNPGKEDEKTVEVYDRQ